VIGDPTRLKQILTNLASNAVKFTHAGRVALRAGYRAGRLRFEVEDTGIGLTEAARARIFEAFAQADSSTTRRYGGTGLGLAISQRLVERMGGELGLDSEPGAGSTFWFEVAAPIAGAEAPGAELERPSDPEPAAAAAGARCSGRRILLVEDDPVNAIVASRMVERLDARVELAGNGLEAVARAEQQRYDLILLDCEMPEMDGYTAVAEIRRGGLNRDTPVVALTAHASERDRRRCLEAGMDDYIAKPVRLKAIERTLARWLAPERTEPSARLSGPAPSGT
jgi:CheY-like chemotaxis protein